MPDPGKQGPCVRAYVFAFEHIFLMSEAGVTVEASYSKKERVGG